jgi:hypothetical protein
VTNPLGTPEHVSSYITDNVVSVTGDYSHLGSQSGWGSGVYPAPSIIAPPSPQKYLPFNTAGVFFTGLSNSTTLRLKMKVYVESAPGFLDTSLSVLATPSAPYDAKALELYSWALGVLPAAVHVSENAMGDWWKRVLGVLGSAAPQVGKFFGPLGEMAGGAAHDIISSITADDPPVHQAPGPKVVRVKSTGNPTKKIKKVGKKGMRISRNF